MMQADNAEEIVNFLTNKFTNVELYDWMSNILERVYSFFLQQSTAMAKLAENQLAFERQQIPPTFIQADYWEAPTDSQVGNINGNSPDRRGITGSARLLQDIFQLDGYASQIAQKELALASSTRAILWGLENNDLGHLSSRKEDTDLHQLDLEYYFEVYFGQ
jgi:hypothetical protein